jgi:hypothetical protein
MGCARIRAEHRLHPETRGWWPIGQGIGYGASFVYQVADLLKQWPHGTWEPDLATGLEVQAGCEAIERVVANAAGWRSRKSGAASRRRKAEGTPVRLALPPCGS